MSRLGNPIILPSQLCAPRKCDEKSRAKRGEGRAGKIKSRTPSVLSMLGMARLPDGAEVKPEPRAKNDWEIDYSNHLRILFAADEVAAWDFEPMRLRIGIDAYYTPDFVVRFTNSEIEFVDVKGFRREAAMVRIKVCADRYRWGRMVLVAKARVGWKRQVIEVDSTKSSGVTK